MGKESGEERIRGGGAKIDIEDIDGFTQDSR